MKTTILLVFFSVFSASLLAQNARLDSLKNELTIHQEEDTIRVELLNTITWSYLYTDIDKAQAVNKEAEILARKLNFNSGKAKALYSKAQIEFRKSNYDTAISYAHQAYSVFDSLGNKMGMSYSLGCIGNVYYDLGDFTKSLEYFEKSASTDREREDLNGVAANLNNIGNVYSDKGEYQKAIDMYSEAGEIRRELKDSVGMAIAYNNIGMIYAEQSDFPRAMAQFKLALSICNCPENKSRTASFISNIALVYTSQDKFDKAIEYFRKALELYRQQEDHAQVAASLIQIGGIHEQQSDFEKALDFYRQALSISEGIDSKRGIASSLSSIAQLQLTVGQDEEALSNFQKAIDIRNETDLESVGQCICYLGIAQVYTNQKKYDTALEYLRKSTNISKKQDLIEQQRDAHELLATIYQNTGNYQEALLNYQQYKLLNDSIFNKQNIEKLTQIEYEYKYKQELESANNRELRLTKKVKTTSKNLERSQRNYLLAIIAVLVLTIVSGAIIFYMKLRHVKTRNQNILTEQKLLRSQMTPHFIFNSLSVLQGMILNNEDKKSILYLSKFSKLLRITLENSRDKMVLLSKELEAIESYLLLQNLEESQPFDYKIKVDDNIDPSNFNIPPMLIQPFIENAIEHAFKNKEGNKKIDVHLSHYNQQLICTITDNGIGIKSQKTADAKQKKSLATIITKERLKMLSLNFKMTGSIIIEDRSKYHEQGTIVNLTIPYTT